MPFTGNFTCDVFKSGVLDGNFDFGVGTTNVFKIALYTNAATLDQDTAAYTTVGEVVATGYTAGGNVLSPTLSILDGTAFITFTNTSWTSALTARGALIYKVGGASVCVLDFGSDKISTTVFQVEFPAASNTSAIIRLS
jgi:hypothetical protein